MEERYAVVDWMGGGNQILGTVRCAGLSHTTINLVFSAPCIAFKSWSFFRCWLSACLLVLDGAGERQEYAPNGPMLQVLGTLQDGGAPHIGCNRPLPQPVFAAGTDRKVVS